MLAASFLCSFLVGDLPPGSMNRSVLKVPLDEDFPVCCSHQFLFDEDIVSFSPVF